MLSSPWRYSTIEPTLPWRPEDKRTYLPKMTPSVLSPRTPLTEMGEVVDGLKAKTISKPQMRTEAVIEDEKTYSVVGMPTLPVVMARGSGAFLWDVDGKQYIDFNAGFSSVNQGHCHPRIVATTKEQCQLLTLPSRVVYNEPYTTLCKKLCRVRHIRASDWKKN